MPVGAPRTWTSGEIVTAAMMNAEIRDQTNEFYTGQPMGSHSPAWTGSTTNPVIGNGGMNGWYVRLGKQVDLTIGMTMGSTTTFGSGFWSWSLPIAARQGAQVGTAPAGLWTATDNSAGTRYHGSMIHGANTVFGIHGTGATTLVSATGPITWAQLDTFVMRLRYDV